MQHEFTFKTDGHCLLYYTIDIIHGTGLETNHVRQLVM